MSAALSPTETPRAPDTAGRKKAQRRGRERGCWVYIDGEQLLRSGVSPQADPPFYTRARLPTLTQRTFRHRLAVPRAMTAAVLEAVAPTDAQLSYIAQLCREHGFPVAVVYSKQDASLTIDEIRAGTYVPREWDDAIPF